MGVKITRGLFTLWIVALAVSLDNAHARNQHRICETVKNMIDEIINEATKDLRDRIEILEKEGTNWNSTSPSESRGAGDPEDAHCEDGIIYRQKCYFAPFVHTTADVPLTRAQHICERNYGKLADILDREHQRLIHNYLLAKKTSSSSYVWMWLGMVYQISTKTLQLSNGTSVNAPLSWESGYPMFNSGYTGMGITVATAIPHGLWNYTPHYPVHGAVCEK